MMDEDVGCSVVIVLFILAAAIFALVSTGKECSAKGGTYLPREGVCIDVKRL